MAETLRHLGVVVDHPAPNVYEIASGDVDWLFVPARGRGADARELHPAGAAAVAVRTGDHQQPGRRPDRPAAREPPRRRDAGPRRRDRVPLRLLLHAGAGPAARGRHHLPAGDGDGHRERDAGRHARGRPHDDPAGGPRAGGRRPDRLPPEDGRRGRADRARHDRGRGPPHGCAAPSTTSSPTGSRRARSSWRQASPAAGSRSSAPRARTSRRCSRRWTRSGCRSTAMPTRSRSTAARSIARATAPSTCERRRTRDSRPTSSRRSACC